MVLDLDKLDLGNGPSLVVSIVAVPEGDWLVVGVLSSVDIKALALVVSNVMLAAGVEVESLLLLSLKWSDHCGLSNLESSVNLVRNNKISMGG